MIRIKQLNKSFGPLNVLRDLDLEIKEGGIFAVLGPNGSGKTTLIKAMLGMVIPKSGSITINGKNVIGEWDYRNEINYMPQIANFPTNLTVLELINMVKNLRPKAADSEKLIELFGVGPFLNKKLGTLSGGTKQKVNIILTFMFDSDLIILDEPTTGLDPISLLHLKEKINQEKAKGKTILITTHIMSFVEQMSDKIVFLLDGNIYFKGSVEDLKQKTEENNLERAMAKLMTPHHA